MNVEDDGSIEEIRQRASSTDTYTSENETNFQITSDMYATEAFPTIDSIPFHSLVSDIPLEIKIQTSSFFNLSGSRNIKEFPPLVQCKTLEDIKELIVLKIKECCILFDFNDPPSDLIGKEIKRATLNELNVFAKNSQDNFLTDAFYRELFHMFQENAVRVFPYIGDSCLEDEDEDIYYETSWPHLFLVYDFMKTVLESNYFDASLASQYVDETYLYQIIELFDSRDCREREQLRNILHRLYSRLFSFRPYLRRCISGVFLRYIYENEAFNGISSLLDILSSIIHGFALPLKSEHKQFLMKVLLPLHKGRNLHHYHEELQICVLYFIIKDDTLGVDVIKYIARNWPKSSSYNQVLIMSELEKIMSILPIEVLNKCIKSIFTLISKLLLDQHFQIVEKALIIAKSSVTNLGEPFSSIIITEVYNSIQHVCSNYWNSQVSGLANNILVSFRQQYTVLCTSLEALPT